MSKADEDAAWVAGCLRGEAAAFEPLVARYQRVLFNVAYRLVGDYEDARDVTQNAFIRAFERLDTFDPARPFFSWLYRIAVNEGLNFRRTQRPRADLPDGLEDVGSGGQVRALEQDERRRRVQVALDQLSGEHREVVVLRYFGELSYREISEAVGVPEKTVKSRLFAARQRLAELVTEE